MKNGLKKRTNPTADIKMFPSFVRSLPDGTGERLKKNTHLFLSHILNIAFNKKSFLKTLLVQLLNIFESIRNYEIIEK